MEARNFDPTTAEEWDAFVARSWNGTFLHTRRFLSYHGDRFVDRSLLLFEGDELRGVFPAAVDPHSETTIVSHPGITYGGLVHDGLRGNAMVDALGALARACAERGFTRLVYRPVPHIYQRVPAQDDLYALHRLGATRFRCELTSCIDLTTRPRPTKGRRSELAKARRDGVVVRSDAEHLDAFWSLLTAHLAARFEALPTHDVVEMRRLMDLFPNVIRLKTAHAAEALVAGAVLFEMGGITHVQYMAASEQGRAIGAIDAVLAEAIDETTARGARYFDLGTSSVDGGKNLNDGLHAFKSSFGAGGVVHEHYEVAL